jgi:secreted trypsin-like serine protease
VIVPVSGGAVERAGRLAGDATRLRNEQETRLLFLYNVVLMTLVNWILFIMFMCAVLVVSQGFSKYTPRIPTYTREVGAWHAQFGRYPYICQIVIANANLCTGFLIGPQTVLTAAHCLFGESNASPFSARAVKVYVGQGTQVFQGTAGAISSAIATGVMELHSVTAIRLPSAYPSTPSPDFAILTLEKPSSKPHVKVLGLTVRGRMPSPGAQLTSLGYGQVFRPDQLSDATATIMSPIHLMENTLTLTSLDKNFVTTNGKPYSLPASGTENGQCYGDSGGPLIVKGRTMDKDVVIALTASVANNGASGLDCDGGVASTRTDIIGSTPKKLVGSGIKGTSLV